MFFFVSAFRLPLLHLIYWQLTILKYKGVIKVSFKEGSFMKLRFFLKEVEIQGNPLNLRLPLS